MPKAGFCKECNKNVWLKKDGSCQFGHPASSISNVYETQSKKEKRSLFIIGVIAFIMGRLGQYSGSIILEDIGNVVFVVVVLIVLVRWVRGHIKRYREGR